MASSSRLARPFERSPSTSRAADGAITFDAAGQLHEQKARVVVVACNGIGTPRLLLKSAAIRSPLGKSNSDWSSEAVAGCRSRCRPRPRPEPSARQLACRIEVNRAVGQPCLSTVTSRTVARVLRTTPLRIASAVDEVGAILCFSKILGVATFERYVMMARSPRRGNSASPTCQRPSRTGSWARNDRGWREQRRLASWVCGIPGNA